MYSILFLLNTATTSKYIQKIAETECRHFDKIFISEWIAPEGNLPYSQWWKYHQNDISVSVLVQVESY